MMTPKNLDEFEIWSDLTTDYEVSCPCASGKIPQTYIINGENGVTTFSHEKIYYPCILDEFKFRPDQTAEYGISCHLVLRKI